MSKETGGPAFPESGLSGLPNGDFIQGREGMTLRDYFAAKAMQGMISHGTSISKNTCATASYLMADEMLKARKT